MADGITRIAVEGFKSIAKRQEIEIAPLTILAGANSSGKSAIMQPLLMLKQTLEATYDPGPLKIDGPNVNFSSTDQFLSDISPSDGEPCLAVEIGAPEHNYKVTFTRKGPLEFDLQQKTTNRDNTRVLWPGMPEDEMRRQFGHALPGKISVLHDRFLLNLADSGFPVTSQWVEPFVRRTLHVPSFRGPQSRRYNVTPPGPSFPGTFDNYVAGIVLFWQKESPERRDELGNDLRHTGLAQSIHAERINDVTIELNVGLLAGHHPRMHNIADVGFGVSQVLPALVALRIAEPGRLVYLEEPEIHLHPRANETRRHHRWRRQARGTRCR